LLYCSTVFSNLVDAASICACSCALDGSACAAPGARSSASAATKGTAIHSTRRWLCKGSDLSFRPGRVARRSRELASAVAGRGRRLPRPEGATPSGGPDTASTPELPRGHTVGWRRTTWGSSLLPRVTRWHWAGAARGWAVVALTSFDTVTRTIAEREASLVDVPGDGRCYPKSPPDWASIREDLR
jgi:hypothetical protein